jgi:hypothetical protein
MDFWELDEAIAWLKENTERVVASGFEIQSSGLTSDISVDPVREGETKSRVWSAHVRARPAG